MNPEPQPDQAADSKNHAHTRDTILTGLGRNTSFGAMASMARAFARMIIVPVILAHLGRETYGVWSTIVFVTAFMRFGAVGARSAYQKYVAEATATGNYAQASRLLSTGAAGMLLFSLLMLAPCAWKAGALARVMGTPPENLHDASICIAILAVALAVTNAGGVYEAIVAGANQLHRNSQIGMLLMLLETVATAIALIAGYGLPAMAVIMAVSEVLRMATCRWLARHILPSVRITPRMISFQAVGELARFMGSYQILSLLGVAFTSMAPVAVLRLFGADAAAIYGISARLVTVAMAIPDAFLPALLSAGSIVWASGGTAYAARLIGRSLKFTTLFAMPTLCFLSLFADDIVMFWTGEHSVTIKTTMGLLCFGTLGHAIAMVCLVGYRSGGGSVKDVQWQFVRMICGAASAWLAWRTGSYPLLLAGFALAEWLGCAHLVRAVRVMTERPIIRDILPALACLAAGSLAAMAFSLALASVPLSWFEHERAAAFLRLVFGGLGFASLGVPLLWFGPCLDVEERQLVLQRLARFRKRAA